MSTARRSKPTQTPAEAFASLLDRQFWPVGIYPAGAEIRQRGGDPKIAEGKEPYGYRWGLDRWTMGKWEQVARTVPGLGVGVCLGPERGPGKLWLIDIEGDGPEAEASRLALFGGELIETMGWTSRRGNHQLFIADGDKLAGIMPLLKGLEQKGPTGTGVYKSPDLPSLELRIGGRKTCGTIKQVQSNVPPTIGNDRKPRVWTGGTEPASVPEAFYRMLSGLIVPRSARPHETAWSAFRATATNWKTLGDRRDQAWAAAAIAGELDELAGTAEGGRNDRLNLAAFKLGRFVPRYLARSSVEAGLFEVARAIGLTLAETEATVRSGIEAGMATPKTRPEQADHGGVGPRPGPGCEAAEQPASEIAVDRLLNMTDLGNAERLVRRFGDVMRYCHPWKKWLVFDGKRWRSDDSAKARQKAKTVVRSIYREASDNLVEDKRKALARWAMESEKRDRMAAMLTVAEAEEGIPILPDEMDRDPWLFNVANGTIDLRTGTLRPHDRADLITKISGVAYDPDAECPLWDSTVDLFLGGRSDLITYFRRICGMALSGQLRGEILPIAYGTGSNGKSTLLNTLMDVFGPDYAMKAMPDLLMAKKHDSHPTDRADLFGKRLVVAIETDQGRRLNETMVKELTGRDKIRARRMRENPWEFHPTHTLILATNHKPTIRGTDSGIWRRLKLIPFDVAVELGKGAIEDMPERLWAEFAGILAWCVRGCLEWQVNGLGEPECVVEASKEYRSEQDVLGVFLDEHVQRHQTDQIRVKAGEVYARYVEWAKTTNEVPLNMTRFGMAIQERGIVKDKTSKTYVYYLGASLKDRPKEGANQTPSDTTDNFPP